MACSTLLRANRCTFTAVRAAAPRPALRAVVVKAQKQEVSRMELIKPAVAAVVANLVMAAPSFAEAGKIFDFNLTLPTMIGEFLLLMVVLEKTWFTPVGAVLDRRDAEIRDKLSAVKDNSGDVDKLAAEAAEILKAARAETAKMVNDKKNAKQSELDTVYQSAKAKVTSETDAAIAVLEKESQGMLRTLDAQVDKISSEVLKRVLPAAVSGKI
jgi:F-type H+-transporting ATPase subunit b